MSILVTPNPTPEAIALMDYLRGIAGKKTLTGQHCAPLVGSTRLVTVQRAMGHYPAVFGQDFGFSAPGSWDGINYRQRIVDEAIRRHAEGFIITLMWHAVPPTEDEPVDFMTSIQSQLSDTEWQELITSDTHLHERWLSQVDVIAWFLKQLQYADVPVIWRPYHEMNGDWFWWGKRSGEDGYKKLYRMLFKRLVDFHKLYNLIWVYNANEVHGDIGGYESFYPGDDVVDILATDVYRQGFAQSDYEALVALANGKPVALGEVGVPPTTEILASQPRWSWFMVWGDLPRDRETFVKYRACYESDSTVNLDDLPWSQVIDPKMHYPLLK